MSEKDHHQWIIQAARLANQTGSYLWETMCKVWIKTRIELPEFKEISKTVTELLDMAT
jgi:hypothetical protein